MDKIHTARQPKKNVVDNSRQLYPAGNSTGCTAQGSPYGVRDSPPRVALNVSILLYACLFVISCLLDLGSFIAFLPPTNQ